MIIDTAHTEGRWARPAGNRLLAWGAVALALASLAFATWKAVGPLPAPSGTGATPDTAPIADRPAVPAAAPRAGRSPPDATAGRRAADTPPPPSVETPGLSEARRLLDDLHRYAGEQGRLSPAQAEELNALFRALAALDADAVPAIGAFLASGQDLTFLDALQRTRVDYPSLRAGLIAVLGRIGGPQAVAVLADSLGRTSSPAEVAALARALERLAPGVYRRKLIDDARDAIEVAAAVAADAANKPGLPVGATQVGNLFEVLGALGGTNLLAETMRTQDESMPSWKAYSMIALSRMPGDEGVRTLRDVLESGDGSLSQDNLFALQMLGQASADSPEAGDALVAAIAAHGRAIPAAEWQSLAAVLRGHAYDFADATGGVGATGKNGLVGMNVTLYGSKLRLKRTALDPSQWSAARVQRQLSLIDRLLAADPPPRGAGELEQAREWILHRSASPRPE